MTLGQREVQNDDVRLETGHGGEGFTGVLRLATDDEIALPVDALGQAFTHGGMIVHQKHFLFSGSGGGTFILFRFRSRGVRSSAMARADGPTFGPGTAAGL